MNKDTKTFLNDIDDHFSKSRASREALVDMMDKLACQEKEQIKKDLLEKAKKDYEARVRESQKDPYTGQYKEQREAMLELLSNIPRSQRSNGLEMLSNTTFPEGYEELQTLRELAADKKAELDSKVNSLLLGGRSDEYWDALREREKVEEALKVYDEQLKTIDNQPE